MNYKRLLQDYLRHLKKYSTLKVEQWEKSETSIKVFWSYEGEDTDYTGLEFIDLFDLISFLYFKKK